mgnify:CR=1 FL=1|tara:strand:- start:99 stop:614 length:516 start_codon:yes stop_codon:yes gene_type:complete
MLGVITLIASYVLVAFLLLSLNLYSNWGWRIKTGAVALVSIFYLITYLSFPPILGWPTKDKIPEEFRLIGGYVLEPNKKTGKNGEIFLWLTDLSKNPKVAKPRAFVLPYSEELNQKVASASDKLKKGKPQIGEIQDNNKELSTSSQGLSKKQPKRIAINFFDLPDPSLPSK